MTWAEFNTLTRTFLTVDSARQNIQTFINNMIRQVVIDLESFIPLYRAGHSTTLLPADVVPAGYASVGSLPSQSELLDAFYVQTADANNDRKPLTPYPWGNRGDLISGNTRISNCRYAMAIDPYGKQFTMYPALQEGYQVELFWDGLKLEFVDADTVPFDEPFALATAKFVKAWINSEVDHDPSMFVMNMGVLPMPQPGTYLGMRQRLFSDAQDRLRQRLTAASPQPVTGCNVCPSGTIPVPPTPPTPPPSFLREIYEFIQTTPSDPNGSFYPEDLTRPALGFPYGGGTMFEWSPALQLWV